MGQLLTRLCIEKGATVIATASTLQKLEIAKKNGATILINYTSENIVERVMQATDGKGIVLL